MLTFKTITISDITYTRRGLLKKIATIFDPLGFAAPLTIKAKLRLKLLNIRGLSWDEKIPSSEEKWWKNWFEEIPGLSNLKIPRCLFQEEDDLQRSELHTFCDASEEAFAAVVYLRTTYSNDKEPQVKFIMAKTKMAPKKTISVAKLELQAALLGARLCNYIGKAFTRKIDRRYFWTDSSCTRNWIRSPASLYKPFVNHRIGEIQTLTEAEEWRFIPGKLNPSDLATRSTLDPKETFSKLWLEGALFLKENEEKWPEDIPWMNIREEIRSENKAICHLTQRDDAKWNKIEIEANRLGSVLQSEELTTWIKLCQQETFTPELECLKKDKPLPKTSKLLTLTPIIDDQGIIRLGGRIEQAKLPYENRHPILLPSNHPLINKLIRAYHEKLLHTGTDLVLSHIRQHFWIIHGREAVKKIGRWCEQCRKEKSKPLKQLMGNLPPERLEIFSPSFYRTSVDYFGPLEVGYGRNRTIKRYGALFTCLTTRAVHLELAT